MSNTADSKTTTITMPKGAAAFLADPEDVLRNLHLTAAQRREILARWVSDLHAVENAPALRRLDDGTVVSVDDLLAALRALDEDGGTATRMPGRKVFGRRRRGLPSRLRVTRRPWESDDDPPPRPAAAAYPVRIEPTDALAA